MPTPPTPPMLRPSAMPWWLAIVAVALAPLVVDSGLSMNLMAQFGIAVVACLSYNLLLGQGGMLSFGHAVYTGLGAYLAIHALAAVNRGALTLPVAALPLVGGLAGLGAAAVLGFLATRKSGTVFAMITLGLGELVAAIALMFPAVFGGESGVSANRVTGAAVLGIDFASGRQLLYLVAAYALTSAAALYAFTATPLGRMLQAVRDNPQRAAFIGYDPQRVRHLAFAIAGFFAGVAGGLAALLFELVGPEALGPARSGAYLVFTMLGGTTFFAGPVLGAALMVLSQVLLSGWTRAWLLYLGLAFLLTVLLAPDGLAGLLARCAQAARGRWSRLLPLLPGTGLGLGLAGAGTAALLEMLYHRQLDAALGPVLVLAGVPLDVERPATWLAAAGTALAGLALLRVLRPAWRRRWEQVLQADARPDPARESA